jgi:hypothetical protein
MLRRLTDSLLILCVFCVLSAERARGAQEAAAQEPAGPQAVSAAQLKAAIDKLGDFDYAVRTGAARTVRRTVAAQAP